MTLHPAPHRIMVTRSTVDTTEKELPSGLTVVQNVDPDDDHVHRGVIEALGSAVQSNSDFAGLAVGCVLFYLTATRLDGHDFVIASWDRIVAWED